MTDVELDVADSFERVFPVPTVVADWDDVLDRAGARSGTPTRPPSRWRVVAIAAAIVAGAALLATPALGIGDRLLSLIQGKPQPTRRAGSCLVARRTDDRVRELARRQRRGLRHGRRRQRASEPHAAPGEGCPSCLVARRTEDRLREPARRQLRDLRHERRREREAEPHAESGERRLSNLVTRRAEDRVLARPAQLSARPGIGAVPLLSYDLYVVNADGSGLRRLTRNPTGSDRYRGLVWSPDGRTIYFGRYLVSTDGSGARRLPYIPLTAASGRPTGGGSPSRAKGDGPRAWSVLLWPPDIYVMNADGSGTRKLTHNAAYNAEPAWSPDGRKIAFRSTRNGNRDIYVMNADGSGKRNLTRNPAQDSRPSWSPDGRKIAFVSNRDGRLEAHVMNADGSGQRSLTSRTHKGGPSALPPGLSRGARVMPSNCDKSSKCRATTSSLPSTTRCKATGSSMVLTCAA